MRLFIFGYGFTARAFARRLLAKKGWEVAATTRSAEKAEALHDEGVAPFLFDAAAGLDDPAAALAGTTHLLVSVPPDGDTADPVLSAHEKALKEIARSLRWVGYLSTTGVYGDREGGWVDEGSALDAGTERGKRRVTAEEAWFRFGEETGVPVMSFRLAGIYGPGRNQLESLKTGKARRLIKPGQVFSRIHVEDIASVLEASLARPNPGAAYNVCDDEAAPPQDVVAFAAALLGEEPPPEVPFEEADLSPMAKSFYSESKRVSNERIKKELGVALRYPTYREGLKALYEQDFAAAC